MSIVTAGTSLGTFAACPYSMVGMVESTGFKGQLESRENRGGGLGFWPSKQLQKFLKNFVFVCEDEGAASTSLNDVTGLTNEEIRK